MCRRIHEKMWHHLVLPAEPLLLHTRSSAKFLFRALQCESTTRRLFHHASILLGKGVLLCGDGNLSYAASISKRLQQEGSHLTATVLESQETHTQVYHHSKENVRQIKACGHQVRFQVDATCLHKHALGTFDSIQFNFPHWKGKTNARRNRALLDDFFHSSKQVVERTGHVHVALMSHQGGAFATHMEEWKQSWTPARFAANHGLLLVRVNPFEPLYQLSSYRGHDQSFNIRGESQLYVFAAPDAVDCRAQQDVQLFCHFNVYLYHDNRDSAVLSSSESMQDCLLQHVVEGIPHGWRGQVSFVRIKQGTVGGWITVFKVYFFGETSPICQQEADQYRSFVQDSMIANGVPLLLRRHWAISNAFPISLLPGILQADRKR